MKSKIVCPNRASAEWQSLVEAIGDERKAFLAFFRNGDDIPDVATAWKLLLPGKTAITVSKLPNGRELETVIFRTKFIKPPNLVRPRIVTRFRFEGFRTRRKRQTAINAKP
jgi:hypothetical protein